MCNNHLISANASTQRAATNNHVPGCRALNTGIIKQRGSCTRPTCVEVTPEWEEKQRKTERRWRLTVTLRVVGACLLVWLLAPGTNTNKRARQKLRDRKLLQQRPPSELSCLLSFCLSSRRLSVTGRTFLMCPCLPPHWTVLLLSPCFLCCHHYPGEQQG